MRAFWWAKPCSTFARSFVSCPFTFTIRVPVGRTARHLAVDAAVQAVLLEPLFVLHRAAIRVLPHVAAGVAVVDQTKKWGLIYLTTQETAYYSLIGRTHLCRQEHSRPLR